MNEIVRTTDGAWLEKALRLYSRKQGFTFVDDAGLGLSDEDLRTAAALLRAAGSRGLSPGRIAAALAGVGITGVGVWVIAAALADPEPTSKLGLLTAGGLLLTSMGALGALTALGLRFSVSARTPGGAVFEVKPETE